jgi:hypothetical protein
MATDRRVKPGGRRLRIEKGCYEGVLLPAGEPGGDVLLDGAQEFQTPSARAGRGSGRGLHRAEVREAASGCGKTGLLRLCGGARRA